MSKSWRRAHRTSKRPLRTSLCQVPSFTARTSRTDGFRFLLIFDFGDGQAGQGLGTDRKAMDREVGEEGMAVEGGGLGSAWRGWTDMAP